METDVIGVQVVHIVHNQPPAFVDYFESIIMIISIIQVHINLIYALTMSLEG